MIKKLLPLILLVIGAGGGVGAGLALRPAPTVEIVDEEGAEVSKDDEAKVADGEVTEDGENATHEYVKMSNQFVIPVVDAEQVKALVVMSLSLEVTVGSKSEVYEREPKIRDSFLQVLFDHANVGGFDGAFTGAENMDSMRQALREIAQRDMGDVVTDVLILDIARQDY
ncbi:MAG: flagellar basal body-associated FliL family protein [Paracoccaceae bacterium]